MADAHASAHGGPPRRMVLGGTTDARYLPQPVRRPGPGVRPGGAQHPRRGGGGRAGQHRARGPDPGQVHRPVLRRRRRRACRWAMTRGDTGAGEPFGALLAPITLRTAGERIAERLVTAIALGEFVPGQRLPAERDLAAMLEVSRTTVREALQRLQAAGYVTTRRGRGGGTFVQTGQGADSDEMIRRTLLPAWEELTEILDFRQLVEQLIARTAAARRDRDDIAAIHAAVAALRPRRGPGCLPAGRRRPAPGDRAGGAQPPAGGAERAHPARGEPRLRRRTVQPRGPAARAASASRAGAGGHRRRSRRWRPASPPGTSR